MPSLTKPTALIILDGLGYSKEKEYNAVQLAHMPNFKKWLSNYPHALLKASGQAVGLPENYIGNSEVGHLTIGAGRIIKQDVTTINQAIDDGSFFTNPKLVDALTKLSKTKKPLHLMGLLSDAGVHSHQKHLFALLKMAKKYTVKNVFVHAFLDGRDVSPQSAQEYLEQLQQEFDKLDLGKLGSICGRFYAMDRDNNWQRTEQCYAMLTTEQNPIFSNWHVALTYYYNQEIYDEFIPPTQLDPKSIMHNGDGVIFFNFRADRARQLTNEFKKLKPAFFLTMTNYSTNNDTKNLFKKPFIHTTLKEELNAAGKTICTLAETEKYPHVTYFFTGMKEDTLSYEKRILIPSLPRQNYVECPEMSAEEITNAALHSLQTSPNDFYLINYANADMVAHSGDLTATIKALEFLDSQLKRLYDQIVLKMDGTLFITADHGNAEDMFNHETQQPRTAHTTNPVYFIMIQNNLKNDNRQLDLHGLSDIAPFILRHFGLKVPQEMQIRTPQKN